MGVGCPRDGQAPRVERAEHGRPSSIAVGHHQQATRGVDGACGVLVAPPSRRSPHRACRWCRGTAHVSLFEDANGNKPVTEITQSSQGSQEENALPPSGVSGTTSLPTPLRPGMAAWRRPGSNSFGPEMTAGTSFAAQKSLPSSAARTNRRWAPVATPLRAGKPRCSTLSPLTSRMAPDSIVLGGVFEFAWPGNDCWDIVRGAEVVTFKCGANKQALGAGRYTIKGRQAQVFDPFTVDIKDGSLTRMVLGGVFEFAWPGNDCWDIVRGAEVVTFKCGANKQALGAGRYTIKGRQPRCSTHLKLRSLTGPRSSNRGNPAGDSCSGGSFGRFSAQPSCVAVNAISVDIPVAPHCTTREE